MNENLSERFGRSKRGAAERHHTAQVWIQPQRLNLQIREYFQRAPLSTDAPAWLTRQEIPTSAEVLDTEVVTTGPPSVVEIVPNRPRGAWESKEAYLGAHYELLREDALQPLRFAVGQVRSNPNANEDHEAFNGTIGMYEKVHVRGVTFASRGIALHVTFSLARTGKKILWEQSKRLTTGSLVVLTPSKDMFKTKAVVATVAARPLSGLEQNPAEIDLFIARAEELDVDPALEWTMIEERAGFYEADRHTLLALQRVAREPFPFSEHLVDAQAAIAAPHYIQQQPRLNLTSVLRNNKHESYENVDILNRWPAQPASDLDSSQLDALRRILAKRLAIVQGPPGTGKTHISVAAIKIMIANHRSDDPPIIIACQTNHAVDQILRHIAKFEPDFVRLGGMSKDQVITERTLHQIRKSSSEPPIPGSLKQSSKKKMKQLEKDIGITLVPLAADVKKPLDFRMLETLKLITTKQADSLESGASQWVQGQQDNPNEARSPFTVWLGRALVVVPDGQPAEDFGFEFEEADLGFEQLKELEAENVTKDDEEFEKLRGTYLPLADHFTCRKVPGMTPDKVRAVLKEQDMWKIPEVARGAVYRYLQAEVKKQMTIALRDHAKAYNEQAANHKIGLWEHNEPILKKQKIIGMTTTGLSKYRGLLASLQPRVVLIEEAAETLEAPVTVACFPSLEHLILVGDHKQLRPHTHVKAHEDAPFYLNISMFERLINNRVEFSTLVKQRRMIPEVRRLLTPIYGRLIKDHASMLDPENRPDVPGMGGVNSFFFSHVFPEKRDDLMSAYNAEEADMIVGFVQYLACNGVKTDDITVLTFYNGQRKNIFRKLKENSTLIDRKFNVVTVDSYQGEENKIVILSLVRSNDNGQIGFLGVDNRVCVALSRAQNGFYLFGNGNLLYGNKNPIWRNVIEIMAGKKQKSEAPKNEPINRLDTSLPLRCINHDEETLVAVPTDWASILGGCRKKCGGKLPCGHDCKHTCHPFSHEDIVCDQRCGKTLPCGHGQCTEQCGASCGCRICNQGRGQVLALTAAERPSTSNIAKAKENHSHTSSKESWASFAKDEPERYDMRAKSASVPSSERNSPSKGSRDGERLVDFTDQLTLGLDGNDSHSSHRVLTTVSEVTTKANGGTPRKKWKEKCVVREKEVVADALMKKEGEAQEQSLLDLVDEEEMKSLVDFT